MNLFAQPAVPVAAAVSRTASGSVPGVARPRWKIPLLMTASTVVLLMGGVKLTLHSAPDISMKHALSAAAQAMRIFSSAPRARFGSRFLERTGVENPFDSLSVGAESSPVLMDFDGDGLLDMVSGAQDGDVRVFRNHGTAGRPKFAPAAVNPAGLVATDTSSSIAFADLAGKGILDAVNSGTNGVATFFRNHGARERPDFVLSAPEDDPFARIIAPAQSLDWHVVFADLDQDGDQDLFVGARDGSIMLFENRGSVREPCFDGVAELAPFGLRGFGEAVSIAFADLDGDGLPEAIGADEAGVLSVAINRGTARRPMFSAPAVGAMELPRMSRGAVIAFGDVDGDGDADCVVGGADGKFRYLENIGAPRPGAAR